MVSVLKGQGHVTGAGTGKAGNMVLLGTLPPSCLTVAIVKRDSTVIAL